MSCGDGVHKFSDLGVNLNPWTLNPTFQVDGVETFIESLRG